MFLTDNNEFCNIKSELGEGNTNGCIFSTDSLLLLLSDLVRSRFSNFVAGMVITLSLSILKKKI